MTEKDYISLLDEALLNRGVAERQEILEDYRQHFKDGRAVGQNDDEIIRQLGSPVEVAGEYAAETLTSPTPVYSVKPRRWLIVAAFAVLCALSLCTLIIVLNRSPDALTTPDVPSPPDVSQISGLSDYLDGLVDEVVLDYNQSFDDVDSIEVIGPWNLGCSFKRSPDGSVWVELSGTIPKLHDATVKLSGGLLMIKYDDHGATGMGLPMNPQALATIYLPENWGGIAEVQIVNGQVSADHGVSFGTLTAGTVSGNITATETSCGVLTADAVSGDVLLSAVRVESLEVSTVNGSVSVRLPVQPQAMTLSTISGDVTLRMDDNYRFSFSSVSGSLRNESQGREGSGGYSFSTVTGDILLSGYQ